ncbi:hypothetical protein [Bradyrhizobium sp. CCBAU 051011]|uniref:hypothetical protein n=1 Tax=Bradyrhizobium sp. CCBAU 051011 TaxID=858422 RepID=UPI00137A015E|nr:hypothetical protein [Bradyrhizobium sp. CCBAU 051011]
MIVFGAVCVGVVARLLVPVHLMVLVRGVLVHMHGGRGNLMQEARRGIANSKRNARREHAKQI